MPKDSLQLLKDFRSDVPAPHSESMRRAYSYATKEHRRPGTPWLPTPSTRRGKLLGIAVAAAIASAIGAFVALGTSHGKNPSQSVSAGKTQGGFQDLTLGVNPFPAGKSVTPDQLAADLPALQLPNSPAASSSNMAGAWEDSANPGGAAIYYSGSGIEVLYGPAGSGWSGIPAADLQTIGGVQAIAVPAGTFSKYTEVMVPLPGDHMLTLLSTGPVSDLTAVAAQMVA